jgi:heparan-alpha-glucosaminide N-acetyltransferase
VSFIVICIYWLFKCASIFYKSRVASDQVTPIQTPDSPLSEPLEEQSRSKKRLKSLDIFRGVAIVLMIFVNSGGGHYWWIEHADWNGLHVADLVFPWFLFIMGVCIPMSVKSQMSRLVPITTIVRKVVKVSRARAIKPKSYPSLSPQRSIILFLLGLCLNTLYGASFQTIRIMGVLQRFGIAYLVISLIHLAFVTNSINAETRVQQLFYDIRMIWKQWAIILAIVCFHLIIIFGIAAPNCPHQYFGPGGVHKYEENLENCTGGIAGFIDRTVLGASHLYQRARIRSIYDALPFDPEGIFGCLLTCVQVFLGVQCGVTLLVYPTAKERLRRWVIWGIALTIITCVLTLFSVENGIVPINKNLWSLSFVTITAALAFFLLSLIYFLVDVKSIGDDFWTIFLYPGMNAIVLYVGHSVFHSMWPFHWSVDNMNTHFVLLLENLYTVMIWILISHYLYHKKLFYNI